MDRDRWRRVRELVETAVELPQREREDYLDEACAADRSLRAEVETLMRAHADAGTSFDRPVFDLRRQEGGDSSEIDEPLPEAIGPYRVLRLLGHGGMGRVYLAERTGSYRQRVAVKVLKSGLNSRELVRRFRSERQILAHLEHPYIAKILDGGSADGRQFLVMELVDGLPIDRYCEEHRLGVAARLELMRRVCDAVQFAHRNLVVHRDLKPANILVTASGDPKLLDFGIAKLLSPETFPQTVLPTVPGLMPMTPDYASPEQVRGEPVTTASDIYALGVLLYELLTGRSPYVLVNREPTAVARAVCEQQPERPSLAVKSRHRGYSRGERQRLRRRLQGDLDTIVMMALRKEPQRRYASVEQFGEDLDRHLTGLPVHARPETLGYLTRKFLRRHRWGVGLATAALAVPVAFTGALLMQRKKILRERNHAQEVARFLVHLFEISDPDQTLGQTITAREILDQGAREIPHRLVGQPELQADLMETMARVYLSLGLYDRVQPLLATARQRRESVGRRRASMAPNLVLEGELCLKKGHCEAAEARFRRVIELSSSPRGGNATASVLLQGLGGLAQALQHQGEYEEAGRLHHEALRRARQIYGQDDERIVDFLQNLARLQKDRSRYQKARTTFQEALEVARTNFGDKHPTIGRLLNDLGLLETSRGDYEAAELHIRHSLALQQRLYAGSHPNVAAGLHNLAWLLHYRRGRYDEAERLYREALAMRLEVHGECHLEVVSTTECLGALLFERGRWEEADTLLRNALQRSRERYGDSHHHTALIAFSLSSALLFLGRLEEAEILLTEAYGVFLRVWGNQHHQVVRALNGLAILRQAQGRFDEALVLHRQVLSRGQEVLGADHAELLTIKHSMSGLLRFRGELEEAETWIREALSVSDRQIESDHPQRAVGLKTLASILVAQNRDAEAEPPAREAVMIHERALSPTHPWLLDARAVLGSSLAGQERFQEGEEQLVAAYHELDGLLGPSSLITQLTLERVIDLYELWGKPQRAAEYRAKRVGKTSLFVRR